MKRILFDFLLEFERMQLDNIKERLMKKLLRKVLLTSSVLSSFLLYSAQDNVETFQVDYPFKGNEKILDIGCGEGENSLKLARIVTKGAVVGVDFSMALIERAKRRNLQAPSHLSFKYKEFGEMQFPDKFDLITCFSAKQFIFDQPELLKQAYPLLKPKGHILVKIPTKVPVALESAIKALITSEKWEDYFITFYPKSNLYKKEEYKNLLEKMHFQALEFKTIPVDETFASVDQFKEYILPWLPYVDVIPKELQEEFMKEFMQKYLKIFPIDAEGKVHFLVEKLEILAQKT